MKTEKLVVLGPPTLVTRIQAIIEDGIHFSEQRHAAYSTSYTDRDRALLAILSSLALPDSTLQEPRNWYTQGVTTKYHALVVYERSFEGVIGPVYLYQELFMRMVEMGAVSLTRSPSPGSSFVGGKITSGNTHLAAGGHDDVSTFQTNGCAAGHMSVLVPQRQADMAHGSELLLYSKESKHKVPGARSYLERVKEEEEGRSEGGDNEGSHWSRETVAGSEMGRENGCGGRKERRDTIEERVKRLMFFSFMALICAGITTGVVWGVVRVW